MSKPSVPEITSYAGSATSLVAGITLNELAILVGIWMAVLTFLLNAWYTHRRDQREQRRDAEEKRLAELEEKERIARLAALGLKP